MLSKKELRSGANSDSCLGGGRRVGDDGAAGLVMYYETITRAVEAGFVHNRIIGTGNEFANVIVRLEPLPCGRWVGSIVAEFRAGKSTV
jgi:hypothetical protein